MDGGYRIGIRNPGFKFSLGHLIAVSLWAIYLILWVSISSSSKWGWEHLLYRATVKNKQNNYEKGLMIYLVQKRLSKNLFLLKICQLFSKVITPVHLLYKFIYCHNSFRSSTLWNRGQQTSSVKGWLVNSIDSGAIGSLLKHPNSAIIGWKQP